MEISQWGKEAGRRGFLRSAMENNGKSGATTYTLQVKGGISSSTIRRLKAGDSVSTNTLDALCKILGCAMQDVIEYLPDK